MQRRKPKAGTVLFRKPAQMRWDYDDGTVVVGSDWKLQLYEENGKRMTKTLGYGWYGPGLSFLIGDLRTYFELRRLDERCKRYPQGFVLDATPRGDVNAKRVVFHIDRRTFEVRSVTVMAKQSLTRCTFTFTKPQRNPTLADDAFAFDPPEGTEVLVPRAGR